MPPLRRFPLIFHKDRAKGWPQSDIVTLLWSSTHKDKTAITQTEFKNHTSTTEKHAPDFAEVGAENSGTFGTDLDNDEDEDEDDEDCRDYRRNMCSKSLDIMHYYYTGRLETNVLVSVGVPMEPSLIPRNKAPVRAKIWRRRQRWQWREGLSRLRKGEILLLDHCFCKYRQFFLDIYFPFALNLIWFAPTDFVIGLHRVLLPPRAKNWIRSRWR